MGYMNFNNPVLEKIFKRFKWTRNNTIQILEQAEKEKILNYVSDSTKNSKYTFQPIIFQFQCIVTTTDTYFRKLTDSNNKEFGVLVNDNEILIKNELGIVDIKKTLESQLEALELEFRDYDDKKTEQNIDNIIAISNHEYLHQGELILMFREAGVELPERYTKAWALG